MGQTSKGATGASPDTSWGGALANVIGPSVGRGRLAAFGMFALVTVGLHAGADRLDDHAFFLLNAVDNLVDALVSGVIELVWRFFEKGPKDIARATLAAVEWFDLDDKVRDAKYAALVVELCVVALVAAPLVMNGAPNGPGGRRGSLRRMLTDPTIFRYVLPLVVLLASVAGVVLVGREISVATHKWVYKLTGGVRAASLIARFAGLSAMLGCTWFLAVRAVMHAVERADRRCRKDEEKMIPIGRRRMRGLWTACLALPLAALAAVEGAPLLETLRALLA